MHKRTNRSAIGCGHQRFNVKHPSACPSRPNHGCYRSSRRQHQSASKLNILFSFSSKWLCCREEWIQAIHSVSDNLKVTEDTGPESLREFNKSKKKVVSKVGHSLLCHPTNPCPLLCLNRHLHRLQHVDNYMISKHGYNISISSFISIFYQCTGSSKLFVESMLSMCMHAPTHTHTHMHTAIKGFVMN